MSPGQWRDLFGEYNTSFLRLELATDLHLGWAVKPLRSDDQRVGNNVRLQ